MLCGDHMEHEYQKHTSKKLSQLFSDKPYQGQKPEDAKILFLGNDANYSPEISNHNFFERILEYHEDGVAFWKKTGKHHPFMLDEYPFNRTKDGVKYHQKFSTLGFGPEDAEYFSFTELLNIPTIGNTGKDKTLFFEFLDREHLQWLESVMLGGNKKFVIINQTLVGHIRKIHKRFNVLGELVHILKGASAPSVVLETENVILYNGYSLSAPKPNVYFQELVSEMRNFLRGN
jgi:hypothetical protein